MATRQIFLPVLLLVGAILVANPSARAQATVPVDLALVRNELKNMRTAQEYYFSDHNSYASVIAELGFTPNDSVKLKFIESGSRSYSVSGVMAGKAGVSCVMFIGNVSAFPRTARGATAKGEGAVLCDGDPPLSGEGPVWIRGAVIHMSRR